jgi:hypothetical protein
MALECHQKEVVNREDTERDDHSPDNKDLRSDDAYLQEEGSNINL